ncbi:MULTISPECIES: hypothetical protein [unclassified Bradyrhizobium]|uniref:hypothetical protein n=1 Tax=unclassified Bradyrhizobium TaxID=2631580 RepID=UPI0028E713F9|nr:MULTISPECIES: hypothetical protein [unclassified Bradyrhizobium]
MSASGMVIAAFMWFIGARGGSRPEQDAPHLTRPAIAQQDAEGAAPRRSLRENRRPAMRSNETWGRDFVHDQLAMARELQVLTVGHICSRLSPGLELRFSFRDSDVVGALERVSREVGFSTIRIDQGAEFVSRDVDVWIYHASERGGVASTSTGEAGSGGV